MAIVIDKRSFSRAHNLLTKLPEAWQIDEVMMKIFREASLPMIKAGKANAAISVPNMAYDFAWGRKKDRSGEIMRVGVINKKGTLGKLSHLFEFGTSERVIYTTGQRTGKIKPLFFWSRAVAATEDQVAKNVEILAEQEIERYSKRLGL